MEKVIIHTSDLNLDALYAPVESPKAVIQIVHGMVEHKGRYVKFIKDLNDNGYSVIVADHRGHGHSVNSKYQLGHIGTPEQLVNDEVLVSKYVKERNPDVPLYMFAHSMGSVIARRYLMEHDDMIDKLILSGTVRYIPLAWLGRFIAKNCNPKGYNKLVWSFSNNGSFKDDVSWLSYDEENIKNYCSDPLCLFKFDNSSNYTLFTMVRDLNKVKQYQCKNPGIQIMSLSGKDDRTTGGTLKLKKTLRFLEHAGYRVCFKEYENMKHEILNEQNNMMVYKDIVAFFDEG